MATRLSEKNIFPTLGLGKGLVTFTGRVRVDGSGDPDLALSVLPLGVTVAKAATGRYTVTVPGCRNLNMTATAFVLTTVDDVKMVLRGEPVDNADGTETDQGFWHVAGAVAADPATGEGFNFTASGSRVSVA